MPTEQELRELALKIFFEENPDATTNPEDYELRAPEGHYYLEARSRAMAGMKEDLYRALAGYEEETENILDALKELGENPEKYKTDEELRAEVTKQENAQARLEQKLEKANQTIEEVTAEKDRLDELLHKEATETAAQTVEADQKEIEEAEETEEATTEAPAAPKRAQAARGRRGRVVPRTELKVEKVTEEPETRKRGRIRTLARPSTPKQPLAIANESVLALYNSTMGMLEEGIKKGATNAPLGLVSFLAYVDLLHGGAYAAPINQLPFFLADKTKSKYYAGDLQNLDVAQGLGGFLASLLGGLNAAPLVREVFENANVPHVFPKLLSDETYAILKAIFAWFTTVDAFKTVSTGVSTFVEATGRAVESAGRGVQAATPSAQQLKELLPLLSLLTA
jgi:hypothetical protein